MLEHQLPPRFLSEPRKTHARGPSGFLSYLYLKSIVPAAPMSTVTLAFKQGPSALSRV